MFKVLKLPANHKFVHVYVCACVYLVHMSIFQTKKSTLNYKATKLN